MKLILLAVTFAISAQAQTIDFRGVPMGASEAQLKEAIPFLECEEMKSNTVLADRTCRAWFRDGNGPDSAKFAGANADYSAFFYDGKLGRLSATFDKSKYEGALAALTEKMGKPTKVEAKEFQTGMGLKGSGAVVTWDRPDSMVEISQFARDIKTSRVTYTFKPYVTEFARRSTERAKVQAKTL